MTTSDHGSGVAPTPTERMVLSLVLGVTDPGDWMRWRRHHALDELTDRTHALLPGVLRRLDEQDATDPEMPRLRGVYRHHFARNQRHAAAARRLVGALGEAGVATIESADALLAAELAEPGTMPLDTARITVCSDAVGDALGVALRAGWRPPAEWRRASARSLLLRHEWPLSGELGSVTVTTRFVARLGDGFAGSIWGRLRPDGRPGVGDLLLATLADWLPATQSLRWWLPAPALLSRGEPFTGLVEAASEWPVEALAATLDRLASISDVVGELPGTDAATAALRSALRQVACSSQGASPLRRRLRTAEAVRRRHGGALAALGHLRALRIDR